jgi:hypothetical protein
MSDCIISPKDANQWGKLVLEDLLHLRGYRQRSCGKNSVFYPAGGIDHRWLLDNITAAKQVPSNEKTYELWEVTEQGPSILWRNVKSIAFIGITRLFEGVLLENGKEEEK